MKCYNLIAPLMMFHALTLYSLFAFGAIEPNQEHREALPPSVPFLQMGIVVEKVIKGAEAQRAGIQAEDILLTWTCGESKGQIESPFDLLHIETNEASRGAVRIEGLRAGERHTWLLGSEMWGVWTRPSFPPAILSAYNEGRELAHAGKPMQAVERWRAAAQGLEPSWLGSWFLWRAAQWMYWTHHWDAGNDAFRDAIQQASGAGPAVRAILLQEWAYAFADHDDMSNAEKYHQAALLERRKLGSQTMAVSASLVELGLVAMNQGKLSRAEEYFQQALDIAGRLAPHSRQLVWGLNNLGVLFRDRGDLAKAEEYYRNALAIEQEFLPDSHDFALTLANLGVLAHYRGDFSRAEVYHRQALAVAEKLDSSSILVASILDYLGQCLLERGDLKQSEAYQRRALSIREALVPGSMATASGLANLGRIAQVRGDLAKAREYYLQALAIGEKLGPSSYQVATLLMEIGDVLREERDFAKAEPYYRQALGILEKAAPGSMNQVETVADLAATLRHQGQSEAAAQLYRQALASFENKTAGLGGLEEDRFRFRSRHVRYYREYLDLLLEQGQPELAFEILESSRARTLLETLSQARIDIHQGADASLIDRERGLKQSFNAKSQYQIRLLSENHTSAQEQAIKKEVEELLIQYQQVEADIRASSPGYAALTRPMPLSAKEIQRLLDADTILLEYSLGEDHSYCWVVTQDSVAAYELSKRSDIEVVAHRVHDLLTARSQDIKGETERQREARWAKADEEYPRAAAKLSQMVLAPVVRLLQKKRLLIVSDGALQFIPFSALPTPQADVLKAPDRNGYPRSTALMGAQAPSASGHRGGVPLMLEHEIVNLPSASVVAELRRAEMGRKTASKAVAVLADPVFDNKDERVGQAARALANHQRSQGTPASSSLAEASVPSLHLTRSALDVGLTRNGKLYLDRLPFTRREASAILAVTPAGKGLKALDFQASRTLAMSPTLAQYRIVHFATHGLLNNEHPELSGLVFSLVNPQGKQQDGFLELQDIYNLNLPVELVVLSGCETGLGAEISGEGLIGLTRGFMYAGASRVMASLWSVSDEATADLMTRFYRAMERDRMRPAEALRTAQIQMWKQRDWRAPYYWAAFQIQGEWK